MDAQKLKTRFRKTAKWKKFRLVMRKKCGGIDHVTGHRLYKGWNLHHLDLDEGHYEDITDESRFLALNKQTHEVVHWLWRYYEKDKSVISRLVEVLERMAKINKQ